MSWGVFLVAFTAWTLIGWFVLYGLKYRMVALALRLYEIALPWYIASVATVLAILLWPIAPLVALVTGYLGVRYLRKKSRQDKHD
jgi:hypothetical protein